MDGTEGRAAELPGDAPAEQDAAVANETTTDTALPASHERPAPEPRRRSGFFPLLLGGVLAAAVGFAAAQFLPDGGPSGAVVEIASAVEDQSARISQLEGRLSEVAGQAVERVRSEQEGLAGQIDLVTARLTAVENAVDRLEGMLEGFEAGATVPGADAVDEAAREAIAELAREVQVLRQGLEEQRAAGDAVPDIGEMLDEAVAEQLAAALDARLDPAIQAALERIEAEMAAARTVAVDRAERAEAEARAATTGAAIAQAEAALESGAALGPALSGLAEAGLVAPEALAAHPEGLATLTRLQEQFPSAARAALAASLRAAGTDDQASVTDRFDAFLRSQFGVRSLAVRDGGDPDAILSRAEAEVRAGRLDRALDELAALPDAGRAAMEPWLAAAQARRQAEAALLDLRASAASE